MRRDWTGMQSSAHLVCMHAEAGQQLRAEGQHHRAARQERYAAEAAMYAEINARRAYGLPVEKQIHRLCDLHATAVTP